MDKKKKRAGCLILVLLFFVSCGLIGNIGDSNHNEEAKELVVETVEGKVETTIQTTTEAPETTKTETTKTTRTAARNEESDSDSVNVYITKSGKKYHRNSNCGNGNYVSISLKDAIKKGYKPCKKCA